MRTFGEIFHVKINDSWYLLESQRYPYKQLDIPWLAFQITKRTAIKRRGKDICKNLRKEEIHELLTNDTSVQTMRTLYRLFHTWLSSMNCDYIAVYAFWDQFSRRLRFYEQQLNRMGWYRCDKDKDGVLIMRRNIC